MPARTAPDGRSSALSTGLPNEESRKALEGKRDRAIRVIRAQM